MTKSTKNFKKSTYFGLFFVLIITTIFWLPGIYHSLLSEKFELRNYQMQAVDWSVVGIICLLILFGEKDNLKSLQFKKPTAEMLGIGLGLGGFSMLYIVIHRFAINGFGFDSNFEQQLENPALNEVGPEFIFVYGIFSLLTAGIAEEIIYRGYATERLMRLKNNYWMAFLLPLIAFALMHYRKGWDHMILVLVVGSLMQFYYLKFRNLTINIIGHLFIDLMAYGGILFKHFS